MNAWKDSRKEMGSEVINYSLRNILKLFVKLSLSGNQSRYKWGRKLNSVLLSFMWRIQRQFFVAVIVVRLSQIVQWNTRQFWQKWVTVCDWLTEIDCCVRLVSVIGMVCLQCVGVLTLILTIKLILRQSKQSQGLPTLLFFDYFKGLVIWKDNTQ